MASLAAFRWAGLRGLHTASRALTRPSQYPASLGEIVDQRRDFPPLHKRRPDAAIDLFLNDAIGERRHFPADIVLWIGEQQAAGRTTGAVFVFIYFLDRTSLVSTSTTSADGLCQHAPEAYPVSRSASGRRSLVTFPCTPRSQLAS